MKAFVIAVLCFFSLPVLAQKTVTSEEVSKYAGDTVRVCGKVVSARYLETSNKQPTLLNVGESYPNQHFTIVIFGDSRVNFGYKPEEVLLGKTVCVVGKVEMYKGKPQIIIANPFEIKFQ